MAINVSANAGKKLQGSVKGAIADRLPHRWAWPWLMTGLVSLYGRSRLANRLPPIVNVAISNVAGGRSSRFTFAGAKLAGFFPVSIPGHGIALKHDGAKLQRLARSGPDRLPGVPCPM